MIVTKLLLFPKCVNSSARSASALPACELLSGLELAALLPGELRSWGAQRLMHIVHLAPRSASDRPLLASGMIN